MAIQRGFGIVGALDHDVVSELAKAAEQAGYATFWANDTPGGDGLKALAVAQKATSQIKLGVGVIPVDRRPGGRIAEQITELGLDQDRLIVGIGSGALKKGARDAVHNSAVELKGATKARVIIGALGPRMCQLGGSAADGVLLNWLTPQYVPVSASMTKDAARESGRPEPWIGAYVRVALSGPAQERLQEEAERYERIPAYAANFSRMGVRAIETCVVGEPGRIDEGLNAYSSDANEIVVRAIAAQETLDAYLDVLNAGAPRGTEPGDETEHSEGG
jgi:alkanesulfonate monooxygenase SsuD/methylene tetrahydromethanopterin reductase-like flavin-dependent oxidoreductase (luciferase family)